jgi:hypothetical protein
MIALRKKFTIYSLIIILALVGSSSHQVAFGDTGQPEKEALALCKRLLDVEHAPNFSWAQFVRQMIKVLANSEKPEHKKLRAILTKLKDEKSALTIGEELAKYKNTLPVEAQRLLDKHSLAALLTIMNQRLK